jgi:hypothetical protein
VYQADRQKHPAPRISLSLSALSDRISSALSDRLRLVPTADRVA